MKTISVLIPTYNEELNIIPLHKAITECFQSDLPQYKYEIVFIDNKSTDQTRSHLRSLCQKDARTKAIFNLKNFGQFNSPYYGMLQCRGDCVIPLCADFQDPVELIPEMVHQWEAGHKVICMIKTRSRENRIMYWLRTCYYKLIKKMSPVDQIQQFTGFGLYDQSFLAILRQLKDPLPFIRGMVAEYAPDHLEIPYSQPQRRAGKTHNNFYTLYDAAMLAFTSYTKSGLRLITFAGFGVALVSLLIAIIYLFYKLFNWNTFNAGIAPVTIGVFLMGGMQLAALGFMGEYILSINQRIMNKPIVIEEERINWELPHVPEADPEVDA